MCIFVRIPVASQLQVGVGGAIGTAAGGNAASAAASSAAASSSSTSPPPPASVACTFVRAWFPFFFSTTTQSQHHPRHNISFSSRQCCVYICTRAWFPFFFSTTTQPHHPLPATSSPPLPTSVACPFGRALGFPSLAPSPTNPDTAFAQLQQIAELLQQGKDVLIVPVDEEDDDDSVVR